MGPGLEDVVMVLFSRSEPCSALKVGKNARSFIFARGCRNGVLTTALSENAS